MADFVAVIRRAVDGLSDNTPELRVKVYEKARSAVLRQLESMKPRPPEEMLRRQLDKLEAAIREVEAEHAEALPEDGDSADSAENGLPVAVPAPVEEAVQPAPVPETASEPVHAEPVEIAAEPLREEPVHEPAPEPEPAPVYAEPQPSPVPVTAAEPPVPVRPAAPTLWGDESWAGEDEVQPAGAAPAEPVAVQHDEPEPVAESYREPEPEPEPAYYAEPAPAVQSTEPDETYPDFPVEDPTEKYAHGYQAESRHADEPQAAESHDDAAESHAYLEPHPAPEPLTEPVSAVQEPNYPELPSEPVDHWPQEGIESTATAAEPVEEWNAVAAYEAPAEPEPTVEEQTGFAAPAPEAVVDPMAWQPPAGETYPSPAEVEEIEGPSGAAAAELAAPAQDYFDEPAIPAHQPPAAETKPHSIDEDIWDIFGRAPNEPQLRQPPGVAGAAATAAAVTAAPERPAAAATNDWQRKDRAPGNDDDQPADDSADWEDYAEFDEYQDEVHDRRDERDLNDDFLFTPVEKPARSYRIEPKRRFDFTSIGLGLLGLVLVAGSGYGAWVFRDTLSGLVTGLVSSPPSETKQTTAPASDTAKTAPAEQPATKPAADTAKATPDETASAEPEVQKFTQRLKADGSEVDEGKAQGGTEGEGKSVAQQTVASTQPADAATQAGTNGSAPANGNAATIPVGVSQKMYLYEERVGQTSPVAIEGAVVWSLKHELAENGKNEAVVQAQVTAPDRGLSALISFKRNLDPSLPASHLVELVFSIPKDFEGGGIASVQRVAMKQTEQDRGDPLIAVPAKITDDFHMIALNDYADARNMNLNLLASREWIDIPMTYRNGRRALITMDKGNTGTEAFKQAISEWKAAEGPAAVAAPASGGQGASNPQ